MRLVAAGASVPGPSHILDDMPNQDALCVSGCSGGWCIAVADGLGSRPLSHIGSHQAVQQFRRLARSQADILPEQIGLALQEGWLAHFGVDHSLYETTCLWARVDAQGRGLAGQVGDGLLLVRSHGEFRVITEQRQGFGNQTETLAQTDTSTNSSLQFDLVFPGDPPPSH